MKIRPKSILVFSVIYLLSPLLILFQAAVINMVPVAGPGNIITRLQIMDILVLGTYLLCAISIYSVRKWGWWLFIASSVFLVSRNIVVFFINPFVSLLLILLYNLVLTAGAAFFFRKHLIAPYFNPRLRIWELEERYQIEMIVAVDDLKHPAELMDISAGGCFIRTIETIPVKDSYNIIIICQTLQISLRAKLIRKVGLKNGLYGYGLMFAFISQTEKTGLNVLLELLLRAGMAQEAPVPGHMELRSTPRFQTDFGTALQLGNMEISGQIKNLSMSGCCLELLVQGPEEESCTFLSRVQGKHIACDADVVWKSYINDAWMYGIVFRNKDKATKKKLRFLIKTMKKLRAQKRVWAKEDMEKVVESTLPHTPYRAVLALKNVFSRN
jgi:hypothetical protein